MLDSYLAGELTVETNHEILEHLSRCPGCQRETESRERLKAAIQRIAQAAPGPRPGFEKELAALLAKTPHAPNRRALSFLLLAAAASLAVAALTFVLRDRPPSVAARPSGPVDLVAYRRAADTQLDCALRNVWPQEPPPVEELEAALDPSVRPALGAILARLHEYDVMAAHHCANADRSVTHFVLKKRRDGDLISIVILPRTEGSLPRAARAAEEHVAAEAAGGGILIASGHARGQSVVASETESFLLFVVSEKRSESLPVGRIILPALVAAL